MNMPVKRGRLMDSGMYDSLNIEPESLSVRVAQQGDISNLASIDRLIWGEQMAATEEIFADRIRLYPQGQIVATYENEIYGFMNTQKIMADNNFNRYWDAKETWPTITDSGSIIGSHKSEGDVLFLINLTVKTNISANSDLTRFKVASHLISNVRNLAVTEGVKRIDGITRLNGFANYMVGFDDYEILTEEKKRVMETNEIGNYVQRAIKNEVTDPALNFHLRQGAEFVGSIMDAMPHDYDSLEWGALITYKL